MMKAVNWYFSRIRLDGGPGKIVEKTATLDKAVFSRIYHGQELYSKKSA